MIIIITIVRIDRNKTTMMIRMITTIIITVIMFNGKNTFEQVDLKFTVDVWLF